MFLLGASLVLAFRPSGALGDEALYLTEGSSAEQTAKAAALYQVNELSNRRRLTTFFINEQTPFYGVQMNYVNVGRGNLTFLNRDLVRLGRIPIVIGRVYDSRLEAPSDFGTGWKLSVSETIQADGRSLRYVDAGGSVHLLELDGLRIRSPHPHLTGIERGRRVGPFIELDVGDLVKRFRRIDDALYLDEIRNGEGDHLRLEYQGTQVIRVVSSDGRFVALRRDSAGRIIEIEDDAGRTVSYEYNAAGQLALVTDAGGRPWQIAYDAQGLLTSVVDPRGSEALVASHGEDGRVSHVRVLFDSMSFEYQGSSTTVRNALQQAATFWQHSSGLTRAAQDFAGSITELSLSDELRPIGLTFDGGLLAQFQYNADGTLREATSFLGGSPSTTRVQYDRGGRVWAFSTDDQVAAEYRYDPRGRVVSAWDGSGARAYQYAGRSVGQVTIRDTELDLQTNDIGLLTGFRNDHQTVRLAYDALDQLRGLSYYAYGQVSETEYQYGPGGLRTEGAYTLGEGNDFAYAFAYDEVGNLTELHGGGSNGQRGEQTYVLGDNNQLTAIRNPARPDLVFEYDFSGRPTAAVFDRQRTSYRYDELGRLSAAYRDGTEIAAWAYGPMDVDAATEADSHTAYVTVEAPIASAIFGSLESIAYARTRGSPYGPIQFNATMARFVLATTPVAPPDRVLLASFKRRALPVFATAHGYEGHATEVARPEPMGFDKPSNGLFLPAEFSSLNCFYCVAWTSGNPATVYMKINGTGSGTATGFAGQNTNIQIAYTGTTPPLCHADTPPLSPYWHHAMYISNGAYGEGYTPGSTIANTTLYVFQSPGLYTVYDYISCGCGFPQIFFAQAQRSVQVVTPCPSSITINSPVHNPNPSDTQWTTNFTFLTAAQITATASVAGSWTITPQGPSGAAAQPSSGSGSSLNFTLSFPHPAYGLGGSLAASIALSVGIGVSVCTASDTNTIKQDTRDVIRQEYKNHAITIPARADFGAPVATANFTTTEINNTAYPIIVGTPGTIAQNTRNSWNSLIGQQIGSSSTNYGLIISSAWRNPERNEYFDGELTSNHQYGRAVDLVISNIASVAAATGLSQSQLWCLLENAGDGVGTGIPERNATQVVCTDPTITHVHVQI